MVTNGVFNPSNSGHPPLDFLSSRIVQYPRGAGRATMDESEGATGRDDRRFDVFISYRSRRRDWMEVLAQNLERDSVILGIGRRPGADILHPGLRHASGAGAGDHRNRLAAVRQEH